jgi:hypothetical protein
LSPSTIDVSIDGGSFGIRVDAKPDCAWAVEKAPSWVSLRVKSGIGPGGIGFAVGPNSGLKRAADIVVNGNAVRVVQAGR